MIWPKYLKEVRQRTEKATAEPWFHIPGDSYCAYSHIIVKGHLTFVAEDVDLESDGEFIAHSRTDIPILLQRINELTEVAILGAKYHNSWCAQADGRDCDCIVAKARAILDKKVDGK